MGIIVQKYISRINYKKLKTTEPLLEKYGIILTGLH